MLTRSWMTSRALALSVAATLALPTLAVTAGCGNGGNNAASGGAGGGAPATAPMTAPVTPAPQKQGLSTKQKVVLLAGAALLFYLYKRDIANNNAAAAGGANGHPQLYREEKGPNTGAIYYRDPKNPQHVIWVTAPAQGVQVPADPDALAAQQQYGNQPAPSIPAGATTESATQYDPSLGGSGA